MTESLVWNKKSIINIDTDTMTKSTGAATVSDGSLVLGANSSATYNYSYDTTSNVMQTKNLKFVLDVLNSDKTVNSRYDESVQVEIYIQYYKKQLDDKGNVTGYLLGINDTYQINPYFKHEVEGYTNEYELDINDDMLVFIEINFINTSTNQITFISPKVFNSMTIMDAIDEYGGGDTPGGGTPPLIEDLVIYSTTGDYTIGDTDGELILQVGVPDEYILKYADATDAVDLQWTFTATSGTPHAFTEYEQLAKKVTYEETDESGNVTTVTKTFRLTFGQCVLKAYGDGIFKVRVALKDEPTIYAERLITIKNNNVADMELTINSPSGKIDGTNYSNASIKLLPETNRSSYTSDINVVSLATYDGYGKAEIGNWTGKVQNGIVNFQIKGVAKGKVKLTVRIDGSGSVDTRFFPIGFTKEFILDVVGVPELADLYTRFPDGKIIDATKEYIDIIVGTTRAYNLRYSYSTYGLESLDGVGEGYVTLLTDSDNKELTYRIYPVAIGKIKFWGNIYEYNTSVYNNVYVGRVEVEIDITALYKELTTALTTNTGLFEITQGDGQLEVHCTPNYSYAGNYSFSQASIDGGSVNISNQSNYALLTAVKDGRLNLICKPARGKSVQHEIVISGQYPKDVQLTTPDNADMIVAGGQLTITGTPGKPYSTRYYKFKWIIDKVNPEVDYNSTSDGYSYITVTGKGLGLIRVNCYNYYTNEFLASRIFKVVQSIGSIEVKLPYPDTKTNWVLFRRRDHNSALFLGTLNGAVTKCVYSGTSIDYDVAMTEFSQYYINTDGKTWATQGTWTGGTNMTAQATELIASSVDVYDSSNNLIVAASTFESIDFASIIYGA